MPVTSAKTDKMPPTCAPNRFYSIRASAVFRLIFFRMIHAKMSKAGMLQMIITLERIRMNHSAGKNRSFCKIRQNLRFRRRNPLYTDTLFPVVNLASSDNRDFPLGISSAQAPRLSESLKISLINRNRSGNLLKAFSLSFNSDHLAKFSKKQFCCIMLNSNNRRRSASGCTGAKQF